LRYLLLSNEVQATDCVTLDDVSVWLLYDILSLLSWFWSSTSPIATDGADSPESRQGYFIVEVLVSYTVGVEIFAPEVGLVIPVSGTFSLPVVLAASCPSDSETLDPCTAEEFSLSSFPDE
jgi:hypothetical protein